MEDENSSWKRLIIERYGRSGLQFREEDVRRPGTSLWWRDLNSLGAGTDLSFGWFNEMV